MNTKMRKFPENLKFGVATAAFQIEGAWNVADKTPSIWDDYCHQPNKIKDGTTGDDACKSYYFYKRDVQMLKYLGVKFYRFSVSWTRVLPTGFPNKISEDGVKYYNNLINELKDNDIEPVVTIYHWELPYNLQQLGGWANPSVADWFEDYARVLYQNFGDRVKTWVTINEPKQIGVFGYGQKRFAPGVDAQGIGDYLAAKNIIMAHAKAYRVYDKEFRATQKGTCGITIASDYRTGATDSPEDMEAGTDAMEFEIGLYAHPIFTERGGFPDRVVRRVGEKSKEQGYYRSRLPEWTDEEKDIARGSSDFFGFNHYSSKFFSKSEYKKGMYPEPSYDDDIGAFGSYLDYPQAHPNVGVLHCIPMPEGIRKALRWVKSNYNNPPIVITENGFGNFGGLSDIDRIDYFKGYLNNILDAIELDGCNVISYTLWSLMDNFEWDSGLSVKFGLFEVNYEDDERKRTARLSAIWYRHLLATRILNPNYVPALENVYF